MNTWWSWLLFINGAFGLWLYTVRPRVGPWFNIVGQVVWFTYGTVTRQWGFVAMSLMNTAVFSWMLWKARTKKPENSGRYPAG